MSYTLAEVADRTGKTQANLRKLIERGQLIAEKEGGRTVITDEALDNFMGGGILDQAADEVRAGKAIETGNTIARLPPKILSAILEGLPTSKKPAGSPEPWLTATKGLHKQELPVETDDPHWGFKVGHRHVDGPRWERKNKNTWVHDDASWTWNGFLWEGGGSRSGITLAEGISPAHPNTHFRPLAPGNVVK